MSGLDMLHAIQSISSPALDQFFYYVTELHHETVYLLLLPLLYWLYDKRFAKYLFAVLMLSYWSNNVLKWSINTPRPTADIVRQPPGAAETTGDGPAFPSGHAMTPLMFWGAMALQLRKTWLTVLAVATIILIGLSRLYLGVHWPIDIIGGWAIGALMLYGFVRTHSFWVGDGMSLGQALFWAAAIPLGTLALAALVIEGGVNKETWVSAGSLLGFWVGTVLEERFVGFDPRRGGAGAQVLKVLIGLVLVVAVKEGAKLFMPTGGTADMVRYAGMTLMAAWGAPWIFHRFIARPPAGRTYSRTA